MISKYGYYKVATGNFEVKVGDVNSNKEKIIELISEAEKNNVNVLTFGELSLIGYSAEDFFLFKDIIKIEEEAIKEIAKSIPMNMIVFVGGIIVVNHVLYNVSFALGNNKVLGVKPKINLTNKNGIIESKYFSSKFDEDLIENVTFMNQELPFDSKLIFKLGELRIGCIFGTDLFENCSNDNTLYLNEANLTVCLSCRTEFNGQKEICENIVKYSSYKEKGAYVYCSNGDGESSEDVLYINHSIIAENGNILESSYNVNGLTISLVDVEISRSLRLGNNKNRIDYRINVIDVPQNESIITLLPYKYDSTPFINSDEKVRINESLNTINFAAIGLARRIKKIGVKDVVIGISGGLDSTMSLIITVEAFKLLNLPLKGIHCLSLTGFGTSTKTAKNTKELIELFDISFEKIDIRPLCKRHLIDLGHPLDVYDTTYENVQARVRTLCLMDYANMVNGIVIGTGDLSEIALGFATYNGDHMSMYNVNASLPKTLIRVLLHDYALKYNRLANVIKRIIDTPISPELLPNYNGNIAQETEKIVGKYDLHDFFLYNFVKYKFTKEKIFVLAKIAFNGVDETYIKNTLDIFYKRLILNQFKRNASPDGIKVTEISLSSRGGLKIPSDVDVNVSINK